MRKTLAIAVLSAACGGGASEIPTAAIVEATPLSLTPAVDSGDDLTILVAYTDGDADLGGGVAEVHDCRAGGLVTLLPIPPIASMQAVEDGVPIEGELELLVADVDFAEPDAQVPAECAALGVTATPARDTAIFCVILVDTAGHRGDGDCTDPVAIE